MLKVALPVGPSGVGRIILASKRGLILSAKRSALFQFCVQKLPDWLWDPPSPLFIRYWGSYPGIKRPGRDVDHIPLASAEIKDEWSCTSAHAMCLPGLTSLLYYFY